MPPESNPFRDELQRRTEQLKQANPFRAESERRAKLPSAAETAGLSAVEGVTNALLAVPSASGDLLAAASAGIQMLDRATPAGAVMHSLRGSPSFGERFDAEREKFPASKLRALPRPTVRDIVSGAKSIPALMPGGETPGEAFERHGAKFDADKAERREAHPVASRVGEIGGDVLALLLGRKSAGLERAIQRGEARLTGHAAVKTAETLADDVQKVLTGPSWQKIARGTGRVFESGAEAAVLDVLKDPNADPLETAAIAAGGQLVGSGALAGATGLVSGGPMKAGIKLSIAALSTVGVLQILKSATPGGEDRILPTIEAGYDKVALMLAAGAAAAAVGATRYGRGNTAFADQTRTFIDGMATVHRGTVLSLLTDWTDGDDKDRATIERVLNGIAANPDYKGKTAAERAIVRQLKDGAALKPSEYITGGRF